MRGVALVLLLSLAVQFINSEKILVASFFSSKSHKITYMPLIEELAARGHQITIVTPIKGDKAIKNIKEVLIVDIMEKMEGNFNPFENKEKGKSMNPFLMIDEFGGLCRSTYDLPQIKEVMKEKYDLIFMQPLFNDCIYGMVHRLSPAPLVLFMPISAPNFLVNKVGGYLPSSFVGNVFLGYSDEMTFLQRCINFGMNFFIDGILKFYYEPKIEEIYREKLGQDIPSVREILKTRTSLVLSNGHFAISKPKPFLPDVIDVGGIHSRPANPLPKDLQEFVSKSKDGFIFFSMGSAMKGSMMPEEKRKLFLNVFSKLKQQVIWKWETETMPDLPSNVKLSKWLPQQDLLGDKNIRMFITHCGGGGTEEAIYHGVPLLGLPMFGDQDMNAKVAMNLGFMVKLDWNTLTEESLKAGIDEILNNKKYQDNVNKIQSVFKDQPNQPLFRGVWWIEYVMRHKGAPQLRSASRNLNFFQYHSLDVIAAYVTIIAVTLYIVFATLRFIFRKVCRCGGSSKDSKKATKHKKNQ